MSRLSKYIRSAAEDGNPVAGLANGEVRLLVTGDRSCKCGCGEELPGSSKGEFRPGHDARYKGMLCRAHIRGDVIRWVSKSGTESPPYTAADLATERGWTSYITKAEKRAEDLRRLDRTTPERRKRTRREVDPETGEVEEASVTMERIDTLKQAVQVCRDRRLYLEPEGVTRVAAPRLLDGSHPALFLKLQKGTRVRLQHHRTKMTGTVVKMRPLTVLLDYVKPEREVQVTRDELELCAPADPDHYFYNMQGD